MNTYTWCWVLYFYRNHTEHSWDMRPMSVQSESDVKLSNDSINVGKIYALFWTDKRTLLCIIKWQTLIHLTQPFKSKIFLCITTISVYIQFSHVYMQIELDRILWKNRLSSQYLFQWFPFHNILFLDYLGSLLVQLPLIKQTYMLQVLLYASMTKFIMQLSNYFTLIISVFFPFQGQCAEYKKCVQCWQWIQTAGWPVSCQ